MDGKTRKNTKKQKQNGRTKNMKNGGIDKRVVKTKNAIFEAFKQLVQQKDMADISISELTQKANITRSTFYMYYDTVGDVRADIENEIVARIDKIMSEADLLNSMKDPYPLFSALAREITEQDRDNRYILSSNNSGQLLDKISDRFVTAYVHFITEANDGTDIGKARYIAAFIVAGMTECFKIWFNHKSSITLEELCKNIAAVVSRGLAWLQSTKAERENGNKVNE